MLNESEKYRYNRHLILDEVGAEGQQKLKRASVLIIGAGGLGCPILQYLTAAGVGRIGIIDFDQVENSNLQRQVLFTPDDIGLKKAEVAAQKMKSFNPLVKIEAHPVRLSTKNALSLFENYDLIVDGTDNFSTRYLVNDACILTNKPLVYGSIFKFEGQVSVFNYQDGPSYRCLFPTPPEPGTVPNCSEIGVIGVLPGVIGTQQANEALKIILGIGTTLSGRLLLYNALEANYQILGINKNPAMIEQVMEMRDQFETFDYDHFCGLDGHEIENIDLNTLRHILDTNIQVLDVREPWEEPKLDHPNIINIPLKTLKERKGEIAKNQKTVVFCQSGIRSLKAIEQLRDEFGIKNLINLKGGLKAYE